MKISVIIPTFNRSNQLLRVLNSICVSRVENFSDIEIIVVDDGSSEPSKGIVDEYNVQKPFRLKYRYQENAGPAAARNNGFSVAEHDIVLFIDDDILVFPDLLEIHTEAHKDLPGSVVFGRCPLVEPNPITASYRYLTSITNAESSQRYERVSVVASGNLSVEKTMFLPDGVYEGGLQIPAGEEFELEHRLNQNEIPIYIAKDAIGWHLQPSTIQDKCKQEFKYGVGAAEVWSKAPDIFNNEHISGFLTENGYINWSSDGSKLKLKKLVKSLLSIELFRTFVLSSVKAIERITSVELVLFPLYRYLCGINLFAGVRRGLKQFKQDQ